MRELYNFVRVAKGAGKKICTRHKGGGRKIVYASRRGETFGRFMKGAGDKIWTRREGGGRKIFVCITKWVNKFWMRQDAVLKVYPY